MTRRKTAGSLFPLLGEAINTFFAHPPILLSFVTIAFIQLFILEVLYFAPRFPLAGFFKPIMQTLWGEAAAHYPNNLLILPKMFQLTQIPMYIFVSSFFICVAIALVGAINEGKKVKFSSACVRVLKRYVHVFLAALLAVGGFYLLYRLYGLVILRAMEIVSTEGIFFMIKTVVLQGALYINLLIGVFITTIFAFVFPIIILEKKGIFVAIWENFKCLWGSFWFVFFLVLTPTIFYLSVLLLQGNVAGFAQTSFPEVRALVIVVRIFITLFIDATVYTAITMFYLLKKENS